MQPHNIMRRTYDDLIARMTAAVDGALPDDEAAEDKATDRVADDRPAIIKTSTRSWRIVKKRLSEIDAAIQDMGEALVRAGTDAALSDQGKSERRKIAEVAANATIDAASEDVLARAQKIIADLREGAYPAWGGAGDAGEEAALAGIKSDLRMVLDPITSEKALVDKVVHRLERAIADGDTRTAWLLGSSHWPTDYLESRAVGHWGAALTPAIDMMLDARTVGGTRMIRDAYRVVSNPRQGLGVLPTLLEGVLPQAVAQLAQWTPTALRRGSYFNGDEPNETEKILIRHSSDPFVRLGQVARDMTEQGRLAALKAEASQRR